MALACLRRWSTRALLAGALIAAGLCLGAATNLTQGSPLGLGRLREPTLAIYALIVLAWLARGDLATTGRRWLASARRGLEHPLFAPGAAAAMLALYLAASGARHLAFETFSHDFSMIDEALQHSSWDAPLYSPILGRSFLSEHFSPILLLLVPLHQLLPSPWLLLVLQPVVLWASGLVLQRVLTREHLPRWAVSLGCIAWWNHPTMISTLQYPVHMESVLPLLVLAAWDAGRRGRWTRYALLVLLSLAVKEDVGLYMAGLGLWLAVVGRSVLAGALTAAAGLAWTAFALEVAIPHFAPNGEAFRFYGRWSSWGEGPFGVALGMLSRPIHLSGRLLGAAPFELFAGLLFLPFLTRGGWLLFAAPWIVNTSSALALQAELSLYYGIPLLAFALPAAVEGLRSPVFARATRSRFAFVLPLALIVTNVAHFDFPAADPRRAEVVRRLESIPSGERVQAMSCFHPVLGYARPKSVLNTDSPLDAPWLVLRMRGPTWPIEAPATLLQRAHAAGYEDVEVFGETRILHWAGSSAK